MNKLNKSTLAIDYTDKKSRHSFHLPITVFQMPKNKQEYAKLEKLLDELIDVVKENERHPLTPVMQIIGDNLERYDDEHHLPLGHSISDIDLVHYLMKMHGLFQKDLASIFGSQANVSKFLRGERTLNKTHIEGLKQKFKLSADFFIRT